MFLYIKSFLYLCIKFGSHILILKMTEHSSNNSYPVLNRRMIVRSVITVLVLVALYLLIRRLSGVLLPFVISFVVAYILTPIVNFFQHTCRLKYRVLSVVVTKGSM